MESPPIICVFIGIAGNAGEGPNARVSREFSMVSTGVYWVEGIIFRFSYIPRHKVALTFARFDSDHYQLIKH